MHNKCMLRDLGGRQVGCQSRRLCMPVGGMAGGFGIGGSKTLSPGAKSPSGREPGALHSCSCSSLLAPALIAPTQPWPPVSLPCFPKQLRQHSLDLQWGGDVEILSLSTKSFLTALMRLGTSAPCWQSNLTPLAMSLFLLLTTRDWQD